MRAKDLTKGNIEFHTRLNPEVWESPNEMRVDVQYKLLKIAQRFIEYLEVPNFKLKGLLLRGSLANFNYTPYSDFDLHLITDYEDLSCDITEQFYLAKKKIWNDEHDITIKGYEVELYVEDINAKNISSGTFNLLDSEWVSIPSLEVPDVDNYAVSAKARDLMTQINRAVRAGSLEDVDRLREKIKAMRQAGLDSVGEFSTENLAFKIIRNKGYLDKLYKAKTAKFDHELSLDEALQLAEDGPWTVTESNSAVEVRASGMLGSTLIGKPAEIDDRLREFIKYKQANPTAAWGKNDTPFFSAGPLGIAIPKLRHAHLSRDISVFYTIEGRDPTVLKIYGVFRHKESGSGTPPNIKIQKQLASQLKQVKI